MKAESVKERIPWVPLILLTIIASAAGSLGYGLLGPQGSTIQCTYNVGISSRVITLTIVPFILIMLAYPFRKLFKINAAQLTYLYAIGTIICYSNLGGTEAGFLFPLGMSRTALFTTGAVREVMGSWWWVPPDNVVNAMMTGGVAVDWGAWASPIFFWMTFNLSLFVFTSGLALIFRKRWIDVERIPFPLTMAAHEIVRTVDVNRSSDWNARPFLIGLLLGLVFEVPIFMQALFPWFPDLYGWRERTCPGGLWNPCPTSNSFMQSIIFFPTVSKDPVTFGLFFLAPLSVSFNVWFWTLVIFALEQVAYYMGYYTGIETQSATCRFRLTVEGPPYYWGIVSGIGGAIAIAAMMIYNSRSYLRETVRLARASGGALSEEERSEATSYRTAYLLLVVGAVLVILWHVSAGIDPLTALSILIFTIFLSGLAGFYTYAHTGFLAINNLRGAHSWFPIVLRYGGNLPDLTSSTDLVMSNFMTQAYTNGTILMNLPSAQMMPLKMASLTGTSYRSVFLVTVMAVLIATPTILITKVWQAYVYGGDKVLVSWEAACSISDLCTGSGYTRDLTLFAGYGAIGFAITFALAILHARYIRFPFEPVGFVIAISRAGNWYGVWAPFLGAWILKSIVLRVGGSRLYERQGVPIVGGFVGGVVLATFVGSLLLAIRFYIPF